MVAKSTIASSSSTQKHRRIGACNNCYLRKTRCDQGKPCKACVKQDLHGTCSGGLRKDQRAAVHGRQVKLRRPSASTAPAPLDNGYDGTHPASSSRNRKACVGCVRRKSRCDLGIPCGTCVRLNVAHTCRRQEDGKGGQVHAQLAAAEAIIRATQQRSSPARTNIDPSSNAYAYPPPVLPPTRTIVGIIASPQDILDTLECYGNVSIASRWPAMDERYYDQLKTTLARDGIDALSDVQLALAYVVMAFSCHTVIITHAYRQRGRMLHRSRMKSYIDEVEHFLSVYKCDSPETSAGGSPEPILDGMRVFKGTSTIVCRIHFFLVWTYVHTRRLKRAHEHLRSAVQIGLYNGMYSGARHAATTVDGDALTMEANRKLLVVELDMADVSICLATGTPTSVPPLPADAVEFLVNLIHGSPIHSRAWRMWLLHLGKWARKIAAFVEQTDSLRFAKLQDVDDAGGGYDGLQQTTTNIIRSAPHRSVAVGTDGRRDRLPSCPRRWDVALALLSEMECAEQDVFVTDKFPPPIQWDSSLGSIACMAAGLGKASPVPPVPIDNEAVVAGIREISLSVRYITLLLKAMLTVGSLDAQQPNLPLCSVALRTAHDILAGVPLVLQHARSPWASLFMVDWVVGVIDIGAGTVFSALNRMQDLPTQHLVESVNKLFDVFPNVFDVLNAHCAATPMSLQVATMTKLLAVPPMMSIEGVGGLEEGAATTTAAENDDDWLQLALIEQC